MSHRVYKHDSLVLTVEQSGDAATIFWSGVSDDRFPGEFINPLIEQWAEELKETEVAVDLRQLEYMNSATVSPLLKLVKRLDESGNAVRVLFLDIDWQRTHFNCMSAVARALKNVRVERQLFAGGGPLSASDRSPAASNPKSPTS
jgi:hypothetical protein